MSPISSTALCTKLEEEEILTVRMYIRVVVVTEGGDALKSLCILIRMYDLLLIATTTTTITTLNTIFYVHFNKNLFNKEMEDGGGDKGKLHNIYCEMGWSLLPLTDYCLINITRAMKMSSYQQQDVNRQNITHVQCSTGRDRVLR